MIKSIIKKGEYYDSVSLMIIGKDVEALPGVLEAAVVMGTMENKSILQNSGLYLAEFDNTQDTDLIIVVKSEDEIIFETIFTKVEELIKNIRKQSSEQEGYSPKSIDGAISINPNSNLALISIAGRYAGKVAMQSLKKGLNVMLFSDNVPLETEIELKKYAIEKNLLMMGPDCGTAIINGVPLAFSNAVERGDIGLVAASGTGLQEVSAIISNEGMGISQAIGTGGRDIKDEVGGMMFIYALKLLKNDENTKVIVLISKPPAESVLKKISDEIKDISKPVIAIFLGADKNLVEQSGAIYAKTLEEAALFAVAKSKNTSTDEIITTLENRRKNYQIIVGEIYKQITPERKYIRGLFSGGTLCDETQIILKDKIGYMYSNRAINPNYKLSDPWLSKENTVVDLGEDEFTVGRLHPMMDFTLRNKRFIQEAKNKETAIILFDLVLGYGANPNPIADILPVIKEAMKIGKGIVFICSVTGTKNDPQNRDEIIDKLEEAGVIIASSNAAAAEITMEIMKKIN